jgi:hypothetical protein
MLVWFAVAIALGSHAERGEPFVLTLSAGGSGQVGVLSRAERGAAPNPWREARTGVLVSRRKPLEVAQSQRAAQICLAQVPGSA